MTRRKKVKNVATAHVKNPCVNICEYILDTNICNGCGRTSDEIVEWYTADSIRKLEIVKLAEERVISKLKIEKNEE